MSTNILYSLHLLLPLVFSAVFDLDEHPCIHIFFTCRFHWFGVYLASPCFPFISSLFPLLFVPFNDRKFPSLYTFVLSSHTYVCINIHIHIYLPSMFFLKYSESEFSISISDLINSCLIFFSHLSISLSSPIHCFILDLRRPFYLLLQREKRS